MQHDVVNDVLVVYMRYKLMNDVDNLHVRKIILNN
jgi:hypothetical protein